MPDADLFLKGFEVSKESKFGDYVISSINIQHIQEVRWNEYSYPMIFDLSWQGKGVPTKKEAEDMLQQFKEHVSDIKVIYTPSGRPYKCTFVWPIGSKFKVEEIDKYNKIQVKCTGYAKRISAAEVNRVEQDNKW